MRSLTVSLLATSVLALASAAPATAATHLRPVDRDLRALEAWNTASDKAEGPFEKQAEDALTTWKQGPGACVEATVGRAGLLPAGEAAFVKGLAGFLELEVFFQLADPLVPSVDAQTAALKKLTLHTPGGRAARLLLVDQAGTLDKLAPQDPQDLCAPMAEWESAGFPVQFTPQIKPIVAQDGSDLTLFFAGKRDKKIYAALRHAGAAKKVAVRLMSNLFGDSASDFKG